MDRLLCLVTMAAVLFLLAVGAAWAAEPGGAPLTLPFVEEFVGPALDTAWTAHLAKGNAVTVKDGTLEIRGVRATRAHIERALNVDLVRVSCSTRPGGGTAASSLILVWDRENSCQIGLDTTTGHRIHARDVLGTYAYEYDLGAWPSDGWYRVAIEVGRDCVRYLGGDEGGELKLLRVSGRPERLAGVPKLLVVGEGPEVKMFPLPNPYIDPPVDASAAGTCFVRKAEVTPLDPKRAAASAEELAALQADERDVLGEQEMAAKEDPTFESVSRHYPAMKWPREVVGVKDHPFAVGVAHDGSLQFTADTAKYKEPIAFFEIGEPAYRFGTAPMPCGRRLHNGYMPVVILNDRHDGLELEQTAFGYTKGFSADEPLFAYVRFKVTNGGPAARSVKLRFRVQPASDKSPPMDWVLDVPAHGSRGVELKAPYAILESPALEARRGEFDKTLAEVSAYWDKLLAPGTRFEVPERRVQDAYRAWLAYNLINVHKRGSVYHVCDGSGFYTKMYGYSVALYCNNMDLLGYHELAVRDYDSLLTCMQPNGLLAVNFGDTDTGVTLYSMSEHYRITRDAEWLRRMAPKMIAMCNWIIGQRKEVLAAAATQPAVTKGLIRYRPYADLLHPAADYFSNGYLCRGLTATADVFAEIGMNDEAARLKQEGEAYRQDILASMKASTFTDRGMTILPAIPDTHELWKESNGSANGYYGLIAPCLLEAGTPAWNEPQADLLIDAIRRRGGLTLGVCRFHDLIDHAYSYAYWMTCLQRGEAKPAILGLYASMAYGMTRETYAAVECTAIRSGGNYWTLPHTYSNTQQLRLLRNMLLREDGDDLRIGDAIPRPWLAAGKRVAVKAAPTRFGPVSFAIESDENTVTVHVDPPTRNAAKAVKIRIRHPSQQDIRVVACEPKADVSFKGDLVELRGLKKPVEVLIRY